MPKLGILWDTLLLPQIFTPKIFFRLWVDGFGPFSSYVRQIYAILMSFGSDWTARENFGVCNGETRKSHFSFKCCISALPEFNQLLDFFSLFDSQLILMLLYEFLNLAINAFSSGMLGGMVPDKRNLECCRS